MKLIKEDMRLKIGGSIKSYFTIHTSYNTEEALMVLKPLNLNHFIQRPTFNNFKELFDYLNSKPLLKYVIQRSFREIEEEMKYWLSGKDVDILVNDYYYFKALTGARSINKKKMRENDNGYHIQSKIKIANIEVAFDIRFVGDNYVDSNWEKDMLDRRITHNLKNDIQIYIPNISDELYSMIYHILFQKRQPSKSKHIPRVKELCNLSDKNNIDFNDIPSAKGILDDFLKNNNYKYVKPYDKTVNLFLK